MSNIIIGGAWPYANGSLHIGHIASLLPGDVLARYYRAKGDRVYYVSGSDCHGTPVTLRAAQEGRTPREVSDAYHAEFAEVFKKLGFSYDMYGKTSSPEHIAFVWEFHSRLYSSPYIIEKRAPQAYCPACNKTLTDRLVTGQCPVCGGSARGDQCDACGAVVEAEQLISPRCAQCGGLVEFTQSTQLYITLSKLESELQDYLNSHPQWRKNAVAFTKRYIDEGLRDRAITRDLNWGIDVPRAGYAGKKIYIWAENVLGYLSACRQAAAAHGLTLPEVWNDARHYYVHGKDNIPFHTIILPALLLAHGQYAHLPDDIISSEYLTLEGRRISTSGNWAIWAKDIADRFDPDALRFFFLANGPEKRDTDFSWREFVERNNSELVGAYGNFVNRTLAFIEKYLGGVIPDGTLEPEIGSRILVAFEAAGGCIEEGRFKDALEAVFDLVRFGNRYYDAEQPWRTRTEDLHRCGNTLFNCAQIVCNLAVLTGPFLPFSSAKVKRWLGLEDAWHPQYRPAGTRVEGSAILFARLDPGVAGEETKKLAG